MKMAKSKESTVKKTIWAFVLFAFIGAFIGFIGTISGFVEKTSVAVVIIGGFAIVFGVLGVFSGQKWAERVLSWLMLLFTS